MKSVKELSVKEISDLIKPHCETLAIAFYFSNRDEDCMRKVIRKILGSDKWEVSVENTKKNLKAFIPDSEIKFEINLI